MLAWRFYSKQYGVHLTGDVARAEFYHWHQVCLTAFLGTITSDRRQRMPAATRELLDAPLNEANVQDRVPAQLYTQVARRRRLVVACLFPRFMDVKDTFMQGSDAPTEDQRLLHGALGRSVVQPNSQVKDIPEYWMQWLLESRTTGFTTDELAAILVKYKAVCSNGVLYENEFVGLVEQELRWRSPLVLRRMFAAVDVQSVGWITFRAYAIALSIMLYGPWDWMLEYAWRVYTQVPEGDSPRLFFRSQALTVLEAGLDRYFKMNNVPRRVSPQELLVSAFADQDGISREDFGVSVERHRLLILCLFPRSAEIMPGEEADGKVEPGRLRVVRSRERTYGPHMRRRIGGAGGFPDDLLANDASAEALNSPIRIHESFSSSFSSPLRHNDSHRSVGASPRRKNFVLNDPYRASANAKVDSWWHEGEYPAYSPGDRPREGHRARNSHGAG